MILRRFMKHVKDQNWFAVVLDMLIVVFGVYLGILLGDIQNQSELGERVNSTLAAIKSDLEDDLQRLDEVMQIQMNIKNSHAGAIESLSAEPVDIESFDKNLAIFSERNDTFYPNFSSYSTLKDEGYLPEINNPELRLALSRLYEREFGRALDNSRLYDRKRQSIMFLNLNFHYDYLNKQFINASNGTHHIVRNGISDLTGQANYYLSFLRTVVRPEMTKVILQIDRYLSEYGIVKDNSE